MYNAAEWLVQFDLVGESYQILATPKLNYVFFFSIWLPIIRMSEPKVIRAMSESLRCRKKKKDPHRNENRAYSQVINLDDDKKQKKISNDSLFAFLNSQFNVEYVALILQSLSKLYREDLLKKKKWNLVSMVKN